jgi:Flp pilus assembly protein TadG
MLILQDDEATTSPWRWDWHSESGTSVLELALILPLLLLLLVGAVDFGRAFYAAIEVTSAARAGAAYGVLNPSDAEGIQKAAKLDGADLSGLLVSTSWGCECSDGSAATASCSATPSCSVNVVKYVSVSTSMTYTPLLHYPGLPANFPLSGKAKLRLAN